MRQRSRAWGGLVRAGLPCCDEDHFIVRGNTATGNQRTLTGTPAQRMQRARECPPRFAGGWIIGWERYDVRSLPAIPPSTCTICCCRWENVVSSAQSIIWNTAIGMPRTSRSDGCDEGNIAGTPSVSSAACCLVTRPSHAGSTRSRSNLSSSARNESVNA